MVMKKLEFASLFFRKLCILIFAKSKLYRGIHMIYHSLSMVACNQDWPWFFGQLVNIFMDVLFFVIRDTHGPCTVMYFWDKSYQWFSWCKVNPRHEVFTTVFTALLLGIFLKTWSYLFILTRIHSIQKRKKHPKNLKQDWSSKYEETETKLRS